MTVSKSDVLLDYMTNHENFTDITFQNLILNIHQYVFNSDYAFRTGELEYSDFYSVINTFFDIADNETINDFYEIIA